MNFFKDILKDIKQVLKQHHISLWDFWLLADLVILFFANSYQKFISFTINKIFTTDETFLFKIYNILYGWLFKAYNILYGWSAVTILIIIFVVVIIISITSKFSKFFSISEDPDNMSRGHDQTIGPSRYFSFLIWFFHQCWIFCFSTLVLSGHFSFKALPSFNLIQILLFIFNSLYSICILVYSLFYVEYPTKHIGNPITLSPDSQYLILKHHEDLLIIKNCKLDKPIYYLVKLNNLNSIKGKIIDSSSTLADIIFAFDNKAELLDNSKDPVKGEEVPKSALQINHTDSMNNAKKNDEL